MAQVEVEKRATRRFALRLPIELKGNGHGSIESRTRDVSARGVCFYIDAPPAEGSDIHFTLTLPPEVTLTESISMRCMGRVVRVDRTAGQSPSVAAVIERYEFLGDS